MTNVIVLSVLISFAISFAATKLLIPFLHKLKFGQQVRDDGPKTHLEKQGTPTMGGIAFLIAIIITSVIFAFKYSEIWPVLGLTVFYGLIGFADDMLKIKKHNSDGLKAWHKLALQFVAMALFCFYMIKCGQLGTSIRIPFGGGIVDIGWLYPILLFFVILGTDNGVNFTDGVDGLCSSVTMVVAAFLTAAALLLKVDGITPITAAVFGSLLGFLFFNAYPAKVFMGDTGALALGGFVAASFLMIGEPILILIVGFVYFAEVLSSIIQVAYFKKTGGKRIFKMAPIHHHFELSGWSETRVVAIFTGVTILLALVGFWAI